MISRPLQRSSVRDILDPPSHRRSDASSFHPSILDLLNPTIWYYRGVPPAAESMEIGWRFDGDSMEIPWIFDGTCRWDPEPPRQAPEASRPGPRASEPTQAATEPLRKALEPLWAASKPVGAPSGPPQAAPRPLQAALGHFQAVRDLSESASDHRKRRQNDKNNEIRRK